MSEAEAAVKASRFAELTRTLSDLPGTGAADSGDLLSFWVPGRIEVLGKHTDYGGGRSLLCAVERGICVVARARDTPPSPLPHPSSPLPHPSSPRKRGPMLSVLMVDGKIGVGRQQMGPRFRGDDDRESANDSKRGDSSAHNLVRVIDANSGDTCEFALAADTPAQPSQWCNYPITVARRIAMNFSGPIRGADIIFSSDLPHAAGVSSSSALVVAMFVALSAANDLPQRLEYLENILSPEDLGGYLGCVENGLDFKSLHGSAGVGTFGGSEDQTAILCARPGMIVQYSFCPVTFERAIAVPRGYCFVIASSGVTVEKTGAALERYNRVSWRLSVGLHHWREATGRDDVSIGAAIAASPDAHNQIREVLKTVSDVDYSAQSLIERFDQFLTESTMIIPAAGDALQRGDLTKFGRLVALSQQGAERALGNQIPETITLVQQARELGAIAASAFGAGFGGSVWALVNSSPQVFCDQWKAQYTQAFPDRASEAEFFVTRAGPSAMRL